MGQTRCVTNASDIDRSPSAQGTATESLAAFEEVPAFNTPSPNTPLQHSGEVSGAVNVDIRRRVGWAWREIRRGAATIKVKDQFYGSGDDLLDIALADALSVICQQGPLRMGALAEALHITPASTTRAVNCLVDKDLVERVRDRDDQRSVVVTPTMAGRERYGEISKNVQQGLAVIMAQFSTEEQVQLASYLERFVAAVQSLAEDGISNNQQVTDRQEGIK